MVKLKIKFNKRNNYIKKDVISKVVFVFDKFEIIFFYVGFLVWLKNLR